MKELFELYLLFFKLGIVNFGGGYAMLPLLERELVDRKKWSTSEDIADYFAIGQCTPGAIAVNVSTFIGYKRKGTIGGIVATLGFITPAFIIIFLIASLLTNFANNPYVEHALAGIRVAVVVLVLQAIIKLFRNSISDRVSMAIVIIVAILSIFVPIIPLFTYVILAGVFGVIYNVVKARKNIDDNNESIKEDKTKNDKTYIFFIIGLIMGLPFGILVLIFYPIIKNKKYLKGVLTSTLLNVILLICALVFIFTKNATIFRLYFEFFKVGICAFGGGLATIPFLSELADKTGWFTQLDLANMIAVSESTPGAMGVNMSTYVGFTACNFIYGNWGISFIGSIISTLGLVSPSIIVIEVICLFLTKFKNNKYVDYVFYGLRAASIGLIIAAFYSILKVSIIDIDAFENTFELYKNMSFNIFLSNIGKSIDALINWKSLSIACVLGFFVFKYKKHPIFYIAISAIIGIILSL